MKLTFFDAISDSESSILDNAGRMGNEPVLICGHKTAAILRTIPGFQIADQVYASLGTHYFGEFDGKAVIRTSIIPADEMLLVSKGSSIFDAGLVYAPLNNIAA